MPHPTIQYVLIAIVLLIAVAYAVYRLHQAIKGANDPCYGCKGCALREQMRQKQHKKQEKPSCYQKK